MLGVVSAAVAAAGGVFALGRYLHRVAIGAGAGDRGK